MILNDVITRYNVISKIEITNEEKELSKQLKVKIMRIRMALNKIKTQFELESREFAEQLIPNDLRVLFFKENKTDEELEQFKKCEDKINQEYQEYLIQKGQEEVNLNIDTTFTLDEYSDIVDVNCRNNVKINDISFKATDFLEIVYNLFIKE